jgi:hypothetical protein
MRKVMYQKREMEEMRRRRSCCVGVGLKIVVYSVVGRVDMVDIIMVEKVTV